MLRWAARVSAILSLLLFVWVIRLYFVVTRHMGDNVGPPSPSECAALDPPTVPPCRHDYTVSHFHDAIPYLGALPVAIVLTLVLYVVANRPDRLP